jgi:hypothetical protein
MSSWEEGGVWDEASGVAAIDWAEGSVDGGDGNSSAVPKQQQPKREWTFKQKEILLKDLNAYLQTEEWKNVFTMFVNSNCAVFDDPNQHDFSEGQLELWNKFKDFTLHQINGSVEHYSAQGVTVYEEFQQLAEEVLADEDVAHQLYITAQTKNLMLLTHDVAGFGKYMAERNQEMEAEALTGGGGSDGDGGGSDGEGSDGGPDSGSPGRRRRRHKHGKQDKKSGSKHKHDSSRKLRKLKTTKLLRRPSERFLDAVMAQPEVGEDGSTTGARSSNQAEKWKCLYCNSMNSSDARSCILCGLAPASESSESLVKRCKRAERVVADFITKQRFDNVKTVAKRWVARAAHLEVVAHMLYADGRAKDAVKLVEGHSTICKSYSNLRSAYLTSLNSILTLSMAMCEWEKAQATAETAYRFCTTQDFIIHIENAWEPDFVELRASADAAANDDQPASAFVTEESHVLFVETPEPFADSERVEMNLQFLVLLMNICTLYTLYNHSSGGALADDYCARYAEQLGDPRLVAFLRRRLTVLIEVYLSRKQHNQAAPLSQQLSSAVMSSPLLTEPLLVSACLQCAKSVVEVLLAQGADVEAVGTNGCTALLCAVRSKSYAEQLTKMLLDAHANPDHVDNDGCAALHYAASTGNSALVAMLMGYGADTNVTDNYGSIPADYAAQVRDTESQLLLLNVENARARLGLGLVGAVANRSASAPSGSGSGADGLGDDDDGGSGGGGGATDERGSEWVECIDEETGYPFFVNTLTGESEWATQDVWEQHEREIQEQLEAERAEAAAAGHAYGDNYGGEDPDPWAQYGVEATGDEELDEANRQAWHEVSQVRSDLRHLSTVASDLQAQGQQQVAAASDMEAKYDEVLQGTKSAMEEVKAQLAGLMSQQMQSMQQQLAEQQALVQQEFSRRNSLEAATAASTSSELQQVQLQLQEQLQAAAAAAAAAAAEATAASLKEKHQKEAHALAQEAAHAKLLAAKQGEQDAAALEKQKAEIEALKSKEDAMKARLKALEQQFEQAQRDKQAAHDAASKEGLKLEMRQHVAMKEKEKIISNFKDNLKALDEGLAKERSRHRLNLLQKLQLRKQKNARKATVMGGAPGGGGGTPGGSPTGPPPGKPPPVVTPTALKALRPTGAPPPIGNRPPPTKPPPTLMQVVAPRDNVASPTSPPTVAASAAAAAAAGGGFGGAAAAAAAAAAARAGAGSPPVPVRANTTGSSAGGPGGAGGAGGAGGGAGSDGVHLEPLITRSSSAASTPVAAKKRIRKKPPPPPPEHLLPQLTQVQQQHHQ